MKKILFILSLFVSLASFGQDTLIGKGGKKLIDTASLFNPYKTKIQTNIDSIAAHNTRIGAVTVSDALKMPVDYATATGLFTANHTIMYYTPDYFLTNTSPGVTDMSSAVQKCVDSGRLYGKGCYLKGEVYRIVTQVDVSDSTNILGDGYASQLYTGANVKVLNIKGDNVTLDNFRMRADSAGSGQYAIFIDSTVSVSKKNIKITRLSINGFNTGFSGDANGYTSSGIMFSNSMLYNNSKAISTTNRIEYNQFVNLTIFNNSLGWENGSGNNHMIGSNISNNTWAIWLKNGTNDSHSYIDGCTINGSTTYAIIVSGIQNYFDISNSYIWGSPGGGINILSGTGLILNNCNIWNMGTIANSGTNTAFNNCTFITTPTFSGTVPAMNNCKFIAVMADAVPLTSLTGTLNGSPSTTQTGFSVNITGGNTSSSQQQVAGNFTLGANYTGSSQTAGLAVTNNSAGTGATWVSSTGSFRPAGNIAVVGIQNSTTTGTNVGIRGIGINGNLNIGLYGSSTVAKANATNIAVMGFALDTLSGGVYAGGFFSADENNTTAPVIGTSAGLVVSNGRQAVDIMSFRDNTTKVGTVGDGGVFRFGDATTPTATTVQVAGSFSTAYVAKTGTYTATAADNLINCTSGTFTVTLPTAVGIAGREYWVTNPGSGTITIGTTSSQTFTNVTATPTTLTLAQFTNYRVVSDGANWLAFKIVN